MLSTLYDNRVQDVTRRTKTAEGNWIEEVIKKPTIIYEYNRFMGGIDIADHYATSYAFLRKNCKWWRKIVFWLLDVAMNNAFLLFKSEKDNPQKYRSKDFRTK